MKIQYKKENEISHIIMDDGKANAMNAAFFDQMEKSLDETEKDKSRILVISGRQGFFSGGLDLRLLPTLSPSELDAFMETFSRVMLRVYSFPIPTIAILTGHAIAGGFILSLSCDVIAALDGPFKIQMNEVKNGIPLPSWMISVASSVIPVQWQREALLHARAYSPREAMDRNILDALLKDGSQIPAFIQATAKEFLTLNLPSYTITKKRMREPIVTQGLELLKGELLGSLASGIKMS